MIKRFVVSLFAVTACGTSSTMQNPVPDAPAGPRTLPTWSLEDVQPQSARFGQKYGLEVFSGETIVVTLVEGF